MQSNIIKSLKYVMWGPKLESLCWAWVPLFNNITSEEKKTWKRPRNK